MANFNEQTAQRLAKGREIYRTKVSLYDPDFSATDTKYGFPPGLMRAVALVESDWNADAKNPESGARGIMQITPRTAKQLNETAFLFATKENFLDGSLNEFLKNFK